MPWAHRPQRFESSLAFGLEICMCNHYSVHDRNLRASIEIFSHDHTPESHSLLLLYQDSTLFLEYR